MTKRLVAVIDSGAADGPFQARARVYRDTEWDEFRVRYYHGDGNGLVHYMGEESDSFHSDQSDAVGTAELVVKRLAADGCVERKENPPAEATAARQQYGRKKR